MDDEDVTPEAPPRVDLETGHLTLKSVDRIDGVGTLDLVRGHPGGSVTYLFRLLRQTEGGHDNLSEHLGVILEDHSQSVAGHSDLLGDEADGGNQQHVAFFGLDLKPTLAVGRRTDGCPLYNDRNSYKGLAALVKDRTLDDVVLLGGVGFRFVRRVAARHDRVREQQTKNRCRRQAQ